MNPGDAISVKSHNLILSYGSRTITRQIDFCCYELPDGLLLSFNGSRAINFDEAESFLHGQILFVDFSLENTETLVRIGRQPQIHPCFMVLELRSPSEDSAKCNLQGCIEKEGDVRVAGKAVEIVQPGTGTAPDGIPGKSRVYVSVAEYQVAGLQKGENLPFVAVGKIGTVDEAECGGSQQLPFLPLAGSLLDEQGGIPLGEKNLQTFHLKPAFQQIKLGGLSRAVQPFNGNQPAGVASAFVIHHHARTLCSAFLAFFSPLRRSFKPASASPSRCCSAFTTIFPVRLSFLPALPSTSSSASMKLTSDSVSLRPVLPESFSLKRSLAVEVSSCTELRMPCRDSLRAATFLSRFPESLSAS